MAQRKWKVLLVDDEPSIIKMITKRLEFEGYEVLVAMNGEEALEKAKSERPDLIVLDLMLPKVNGFDVCAELKQHQRSWEIPVITIFSGDSSTDDQARCLKLGAAAYVTKGQGAAPLMAQVKELLAGVPQ